MTLKEARVKVNSRQEDTQVSRVVTMVVQT